MKYIRVKDTIIDVCDFFGINKDYAQSHKDFFERECNKSDLYREAVKKADTIEELCDEFVLFYMETKNPTPIPWATYERTGVWKKEKEHITKEIVSHPPYRQPVLYGAIWTDKGLIYVAKMNKNRNFELILEKE